jgi:phosphoribosylamine--glycine ligase
VVLPRLESDLGEIILAVVDGELDKLNIAWKPQACITVVMASGGYPGSYQTGYLIKGLNTELANDVIVFHSGTSKEDGRIVTAGGRVLSITALGNSLTQARECAYQTVQKITFEGSQYRSDIANRALSRK